MSKHAIQAMMLKTTYEGYALSKVEPLADLPAEGRNQVLMNDLKKELEKNNQPLLDSAAICLFLAKAIDDGANNSEKKTTIATLTVFNKHADKEQRAVIAELEKAIINEEPVPTTPGTPS